MSEEDIQQEVPATDGQGINEEQHQADIQQEGSAVDEEAQAPGIAVEAGVADLADAYADGQADSKDDVGPTVGDATPDGDNQSKDQKQDATPNAEKTDVATEEEQKSEEQTAEDTNVPAAVEQEQAATEEAEKIQDAADSEVKQGAADTVSQDVDSPQTTDAISPDVEEQAAEPETKDEPPVTEGVDCQSEKPAGEEPAAGEPNNCTQEEPTADNNSSSDAAAVTEPSGPPALYQGFGIESQKDEQTAEEKEPKQTSKDSKKQDAAPPKSVSQKTLNATAKKTSPSKKAAPPIEPPPADAIKAHHPWLDGTFRTPKGRVVTAKELCESIDKMTRAYASKQLDGNEDGSPAPPQNPSQYNTKKLSSDELEAVVSRLYTSKSAADAAEAAGQLERVTLKFDEQGNEQWVPVKKADPDENRAYMCALYERCLEQRKKTEEELAAKYLQPLGKPRKVAC